MFKSLQKVNMDWNQTSYRLCHWNALFSYSTYFNYLNTIYKRFQERKKSYRLEKLLEKDLVHFVSDSIFKPLKFDYLSSETVSNQKIKMKNDFLDDCVFLEIRLTLRNQLLPNMRRNK